jgi:hypothetical protein
MAPLSFLDLPGEIRNQIYKNLLLILPLSTPRVLGDPPIYPQILAVCRKVHEEAIEILYGSNTFLAHPNLLTDLPRLRLYYDTISEKHLIDQISRYHIRVRLDCEPRFSAMKVQNAFTGVEELTIEVFQAQLGGSDYSVLRRFEGVRGVKRARIYGSIYAFPEYAKWLQNAMMSPVGAAPKPFDQSL